MKDTSRKLAAAQFRKLRYFTKSLTPEVREQFKELRKNVWWWRPSARTHPIDFNRSNTLAFNYELARRVKRKLRLQRFPLVAGACRFMVPALDDTPPEQLPCRAAGDKPVKEKGWALVTAEWNLKISNAPLMEAFMDFIRYARKSQGIPEPRRNADTRRKPPS